MDGDVKVFRLIAQPVPVPLTLGMGLDELNIPPRYQRFKAATLLSERNGCLSRVQESL